ncbi:protein YLS7-like [Trifolium pratense]|uniref:Protein YLS7-like n=3 Tax=Trifolium pratense TaxID=57577 RepID=A0A2K3N6F9_TRIPR|nr:protein YLS7-like [Trifolium pratense]
MADTTKYVPIATTTGNNNLHKLDLKNLFTILKTKTTIAFAYAFMLVFIAFTLFLAFSPSPTISTTTPSSTSQFSSIFEYFFPNNTTSLSQSQSQPHNTTTNLQYPFDPFQNKTSISRSTNVTTFSQPSNQDDAVSVSVSVPTTNNTIITNSTSQDDAVSVSVTNNTIITNSTSQDDAVSVPITNNTIINNSTSQIVKNHTSSNFDETTKAVNSNHTTNATSQIVKKEDSSSTGEAKTKAMNATTVVEGVSILPNKNLSSNSSLKGVDLNNYTQSLAKKKNNGNNKYAELMESLMNCDFFDGEWVKDDSYPLYKPGSCSSIIDEQFNCIRNGRPDKDYQKYKWKPKGCTLPRLDGHKLLDLLRGKRLVFVGDSLNRNMWESLICVLRNSVKNKKKVYEANGRVHFRGEASYSFIFKDYNFSVELFVSPFLVQEWEMPDKNGTKKETLRLDLVGQSSDQYKDADIIVFNTGHWWTHDKTSKGKGYYQEGSHVYDELNVLEAFRRAITTWGKWVDAKVNPSKSLVLFRGYSASHFSGGQWNSGGACDHETAPIDNEKYLTEYPPKMRVLEKVLKYMKTPVSYLNITRMTDFRKDGHPSVYRKQNLSPEERKSPLRYQDCSHWCLPGVPDAWNEILYAEILMREYRNKQQQKRT